MRDDTSFASCAPRADRSRCVPLSWKIKAKQWAKRDRSSVVPPIGCPSRVLLSVLGRLLPDAGRSPGPQTRLQRSPVQPLLTLALVQVRFQIVPLSACPQSGPRRECKHGGFESSDLVVIRSIAKALAKQFVIHNINPERFGSKLGHCSVLTM